MCKSYLLSTAACVIDSICILFFLNVLRVQHIRNYMCVIRQTNDYM